MKQHFWLLALIPAVFVAGVAVAQYPIMDAVADRVIQKYQQSTCEQLWQNRGKPESEREQQAIDLRIEARLAFAPLGSMEQWFGLCRDAEARSGKIGDEGRRLASIVAKAVALNFYGTPFEGISAAEQAVAVANVSSDKAWLSYAQYVLGQAHFIAGHYRDAMISLDQASARR